MMDQCSITRTGFLKMCGGMAASVLFGQRLPGGTGESPMGEAVQLKSWELTECASLPGKRKQMMRITATNGAIGLSRPIDNCRDLQRATTVVQGRNLLEHESLHDAMTAGGVPKSELATLDIACWDLHARMLNKPLHVLLGTKRGKALRYGDVRGTQPDFSPVRYADSVARYLERTGLGATKLHFPGSMGTVDSIFFKDVLETLKQVRKAVGQDAILAWDPYPRSAESATASLSEAREILALMDELRYSWIEGPLPPVPFETQIPRYAELLRTAPTRLRVQAEGPGSSIGDGTPFEVMKQWVEAQAVNQCSTDAYIAAGVTNAVRMLEYARTHPPLVINLHWAWAPHAHLAMAYDDTVMPCVEFPMSDDVPREYLAGPSLLAPDWPGIYRIDGDAARA